MIFPPITELTLLGVFEPGVPNRERLLLRPTETVNLAPFGVMLGLRLANGQTMPLWDNFFWFGEILISPPAWISLVTAPGKPEVTTDPATGHPVHIFYWNRKQTIFHDPNLVPVLFQFNAVLVGAPMPSA